MNNNMEKLNHTARKIDTAARISKELEWKPSRRSDGDTLDKLIRFALCICLLGFILRLISGVIA